MIKILISALVAVTMLGGCSGMQVPGLPTGVVFASNPLASAMRQCATLADVLTPGVSPEAVIGLARGVANPMALGNTAQGAMRNCAGLMDAIAD